MQRPRPLFVPLLAPGGELPLHESPSQQRGIPGFFRQPVCRSAQHLVQPGKRAGTGGSEYPDLKAEFSDIPHERGTLSMARSSSPNSANSQFFICFKAAPHLDRQYTVFGKVIQGMEFVDLIKRGESPNGEVTKPDKIISLSAN